MVEIRRRGILTEEGIRLQSQKKERRNREKLKHEEQKTQIQIQTRSEEEPDQPEELAVQDGDTETPSNVKEEYLIELFGQEEVEAGKEMVQMLRLIEKSTRPMVKQMLEEKSMLIMASCRRPERNYEPVSWDHNMRTLLKYCMSEEPLASTA